MKIGAKVDVFNWRMRERRTELGVTQRELWLESHVNVNDIQSIEKLRSINGSISEVESKLHKIAVALDMPFDVLFPQDYLDMLVKKKLPRRRKPFIWCRDISLDQLASVESGLLLPSAEEIVLDNPDMNGLKEETKVALDSLSDREREVLEMRFGLKDGQAHTLEEVGEFFGVTRECVRQIEAQALRKLRHPKRSRRLVEYTERNG